MQKQVDTTRYHLWTDALHARELAKQAENRWDRGTYVRWVIITAWTAFETVCEDLLGTTGLGYRFRDNLNQAISRAGLSPLDWSHGVWQRANAVHAKRKEYVHPGIPQERLFADVGEAEEAISVLREAIKSLYQLKGESLPPWVNDDSDPGWTGGSQFGVPTLTSIGADPDDPNAIRIGSVYQGEERITDICPPGTDPVPIMQRIVRSTSIPISAVRAYKGSQLLLEWPLQMRGS